jgi:hypothetical protein
MHKRSFGWITIKIYNEIKGLKVPTYVPRLIFFRSSVAERYHSFTQEVSV